MGRVSWRRNLGPRKKENETHCRWQGPARQTQRKQESRTDRMEER